MSHEKVIALTPEVPAVAPAAEAFSLSRHLLVVARRTAILSLSCNLLLGTGAVDANRSVEAPLVAIPPATAEQNPAPVTDDQGVEMKGGELEFQGPTRFDIFPVTLDASGFEPVKKTEAQLRATLTSAWMDIAEAAGGVLSTEVNIDVKPEQKITLEGVESVKDFCENKDPNFRDNLRKAVVPQHGGPEAENTVNIIVLNQKIWTCGTADAGVGNDQVYYDEDYFTPYGVEHETGHSLGIGHSNKLLRCRPPRDAISPLCVNEEYGDFSTVMGGYRYSLGDPDPFNAFALSNLGALRPSEILQLTEGKTVFDLAAVSDKSGNGIRLASIALDPVEISVLDEKNKHIYTKTINSVYFELSSAYTDGAKSRALSLKVYAADANATKYEIPETFLIPCNDKYSFGKESSFGKVYTFEIGGRSIGFTLKSLMQSSKKMTGEAQVLVNVAKIPQPEYISGV